MEDPAMYIPSNIIEKRGHNLVHEDGTAWTPDKPQLGLTSDRAVGLIPCGVRTVSRGAK